MLLSEFEPSYLSLFQSGEFHHRVIQAQTLLSPCRLCPRKCGVDRLNNGLGECQIGNQVRVYSFMPHHGEENVLRGKKGSGTIFFSSCNLHCVFCQNSDISQENRGLEISAEELATMMIELQQMGCHNINFVSPSHAVAQILRALEIAISQGLHIPLVYNSGGYDALETLCLLEGIVDIYLPDMKYAGNANASKYSGVQDYVEVNQTAVLEMQRQVGELQFDQHGIAFKGLLVRHLVLPNELAGTEQICQFLRAKVSPHIHINVMGQYRPDYQAYQYAELDRRPNENELQKAFHCAQEAGLNLV